MKIIAQIRLCPLLPAPLAARAVPCLLALASVGAALGVIECGRQSAAAYLMESGTLPGLLAASELASTRADLYRELAFLDPDRSAGYLRMALQRNPSDSKSWSQLALLKEAEGDYGEALAALEEAARRDTGFASMWALCGYYFRRNDDASFWKWARRAAASEAADLPLVIGLCWRRSPSAEEVMAVLPHTCEARNDLFSFLRDQNADAAAAMPVARHLAACGDTRSRNLLIDFVTRSALRQTPGAATEIWNLLSGRGSIPFPALGHDGNMVTNGTFERLPSRQGFDWHFDPAPGISLHTGDSPSLRLLIGFSGDQPATASVIWQPVVLEEGGDYVLSFSYETGAAPAGLTGLHWRIATSKTGAPLIPDSPDWSELATESGQTVWRFQSPRGELPVAMLYYTRPRGQTNLRGTVSLGNIQLRSALPGAGN